MSHKFAEKGSYASEEENGEYMCQLSPNNPLWGHHTIRGKTHAKDARRRANALLTTLSHLASGGL